MSGSTRFAIVFTSVSGGIAIGLGAFGAHGLRASLEASGHADTWRTAALYHLLHSVVLLAITATNRIAAAETVRMWTVRFFAGGILLFSGSLYALSLGGPQWLGPITPLGGVAFLAGWLMAGRWLWKRAGG